MKICTYCRAPAIITIESTSGMQMRLCRECVKHGLTTPGLTQETRANLEEALKLDSKKAGLN
jgi:hypothetical protein